ncbi:MAG TPA: LOG family protein [Spirochaetia bacterium]|nr:LOG family protein [Spirochaetia bacterium]
MAFKKIKAITVFGFADCPPESSLYRETLEVTRLLAQNGLEIVNGGGPGVMRAATEGAHEGGGTSTVATFYPKFIENFEGKDHLNKADREVIMNNYVDRTMKLLELGNAYVIFNGGTGTLSEFGMAWGLAYLYFGHHKPLILYGDFWFSIMESLVKNMLIGSRPGALRVYRIATTPEMVLQYLQEFDTVMDDHRQNEQPVVDDGSGEKAFFD